MRLRRDHVAGGVFVVAGALVLAASGDLPFGTLASPGAGMLPTLVVALMIAFGLVLFARARRSPPLAEVDWGDLEHAVCVGLVAAAGTVLYVPLGFALTVPLLLFILVFFIERRPLLPAMAFSVGAAAAVYALFALALRTPLPRSLLGF
jgi:hypothetical protein